MAELKETVQGECVPEATRTGGVLQHYDSDHDETTGTILQDQRDDRPYPESELMCSEGGIGCEKNSTFILTEGDHKNRSYHYHQETGKTYSEDEMLTVNKSSGTEKNSNCCKQDEEMLLDDDNISHHCRNSYYKCDDYDIAKVKSQCHVYLEEHTYLRKNKATPHIESHLERSYEYDTYAMDETVNQFDESLTVKSEDYVNNVHSNSESKSYIQMKNLSVDDQDSCCSRNYEFLQDSSNANQINSVSSEKHEICDATEYDCPDKNHEYKERYGSNYKRGHFSDEYYRYDKVYPTEEAPSMVEKYSPEQSCVCQLNDCRDYKREELITRSTEHENCCERSYNYLEGDDRSENKPYALNNGSYPKSEFEHRERVQIKCNSLKGESEYTREVDNTFKEDDTLAVDLRILRPSRYAIYSSQKEATDTIQEPMMVSHEIDDTYITPHSEDEVCKTETCNNQETYLVNSSYNTPDQTSCENEYINPAEQPKEALSCDYSICETKDVGSNNLWDAATNTDHPRVEDKESQTGLSETRDVAVQTNVENTIIPLTLFKTIKKDTIKHTCHICHRVYISKNSFDRHLRTHEKEKNKIIANLRFTTEAKLQICKRTFKTKNVQSQNPIIIHVPRSITKCEMCHKIFRNQNEKDNHDCTFKPFILIKCPECYVKFYTTGALNEHIGLVHRKENAYYCIFCNKSFNTGYSFHLHLDEHLSTQ